MRTLFCQLSVLAVVLSQSQQQSAIQVDMEVQLQKTIAIYNATSSESNRGLQHTSMEIEICS